MKVKDVLGDDGSHIVIEPGENISVVDNAKFVGICTHHSPAHVDDDELWVFKRKKFLKAVAKALNVVIYEPNDAFVDSDEPGYYK